MVLMQLVNYTKQGAQPLPRLPGGRILVDGTTMPCILYCSPCSGSRRSMQVSRMYVRGQLPLGQKLNFFVSEGSKLFLSDRDEQFL